MPSNISNKPLAESFLAQHRTKLFAEERLAVEKTLGKGALKFKVGTGGMRALFKARMQDTKTPKG